MGKRLNLPFDSELLDTIIDVSVHMNEVTADSQTGYTFSGINPTILRSSKSFVRVL